MGATRAIVRGRQLTDISVFVKKLNTYIGLPTIFTTAFLKTTYHYLPTPYEGPAGCNMRAMTFLKKIFVRHKIKFLNREMHLPWTLARESRAFIQWK